jgi:hypothetical protein
MQTSVAPTSHASRPGGDLVERQRVGVGVVRRWAKAQKRQPV